MMARKQSAFLSQMSDIRRAAQEATRKTFMQYLTDTAVIALNEEFGFGKDRLNAFMEAWGVEYDKWFDALRSIAESDYYRQKLDERLKQLDEEHYIPFDERYQFLPEMKY